MRTSNKPRFFPPQASGAGDETSDAQEAATILNRAAELQRQTPGLSLATATVMAQREDAGRIMNRAAEIQKQTPGLSLATAITLAQRELE